MSPPLKYKTPQEERHKEMISIVRDVLGEDYWEIIIEKLTIQENLLERYTEVACLIYMNDKSFSIKETGRGPIDALFNGLKNNFKESYLSFNGLNFCEFSIDGDVGNSLNSASEVECTLAISSTNNHNPLIYRYKDASINRAAICVVLSAIEYYINSERAMKKLRRWAADAQRRNRADLFQQNVLKMSRLLEGASYTDTLVTFSKTHEFED